MAYSVRVAEAFEDDLCNVVSYLVDVQGAEGAAESVMRAVDRAKALLADQPLIHAVSSKARLCEGAYREHFVLNYSIVYRVEGDEVLFLRFFHQARRYERFVMEWD